MPSQNLHSHSDPKGKEFFDCELRADETSALLPPHSPVSPPESIEIKGYLLMALSCVGFSGTLFLVRFAHEKYNFPMASALFIRGFVQLLFVILYTAIYLPFSETFSVLSQKQVKLLALRGIAGALASLAFYAALQKLPLGDAVTIFFCSPVITMILSSIVLRERITLIDSLAAATCLTGVALVARPEFSESGSVSSDDRIIGGLYSIISAVLASVEFVIIRNLGTSIHCMVSIFSLSCCLTSTGILLGGGLSPSGFWMMKQGTLMNILAGLFSCQAQYCMNRAVQLCPAGPGSMIRNLDVPLSYLLGILFLNESPSLPRLFGSFLVLFGAFMISFRQIAGS